MKKIQLLWFLLLVASILNAQSDSVNTAEFVTKSSHSIGLDFDFSTLSSFDIHYRYQKGNNNIIFGFQRFNTGLSEGNAYRKWNDSTIEKSELYIDNLFNDFYLGYQFKKPIKPYFQFYCGAYAMLGWQQSRLNIAKSYYPLQSQNLYYGEADSTAFTRGNLQNNMSYGLYTNVGLEFLLNPYLSVNLEVANRFFYDDKLIGKGFDKIDFRMCFNAGMHFYFNRKD